MERVAQSGKIWLCPWDKYGYFKKETPMNTVVYDLFSSLELFGWLKSHSNWWVIGKWNEKHYAYPITITTAGRKAFEEWEKYDMEYVTGGLIEPGWRAKPSPTRRKPLS